MSFQSCRRLMTPRSVRHGMSILELVGCVFAVVGGIWLGAVWLGLTMKEVTYTAAERTGVWNRLPDTWRAAIDPKSDIVPPSPEVVSKRLNDEYLAISNEIDRLKFYGKTDKDLDSSATTDAQQSFGASQEATENYWRELSRIVYGEARLQGNAEAAHGDTGTSRFHAVQSRISRFAADSVEALPQKGVDSRALLLGKQVAQWFRRSAELRNDAFETWSSSDSSIRNPLGDARLRTERQLHMETELLTAKATAVRAALSSQYGTDFPPLGDLSTE